MPGGPSQPKPRDWRVEYPGMGDPETGEFLGVDREQAQQAFLELEAMLFRLGGAVIVAAERVRHEDGSFETVALKVRYESFMPPVDRNGGQERAPEPVTVDAEPEEEQEPGPPPVSATDGIEEAELEPSSVE